jgi:NAD(P)-dependent dehydrogenase (short-subunit alcohol dehydrogenase family)
MISSGAIPAPPRADVVQDAHMPRGIVLVTGCSSPSGLGWAVARALAGRGFPVVATVRRREQLERVAGPIREGLPAEVAGRLELRVLDLLVAATVESVVTELDARRGPEVLINNAGYGLIGGIEQATVEQARANMETNFLATMALVQRVLPGMRARRSGHLVNVSSVFAAGLCPPGIGWYIASKAALEAAAQALAVELAPSGIRVTNFQPGPVMTDLSRDWGARLAPEADPRPGLVDELYGWVQSDAAPTVQGPEVVAEALADVVASERPPLAAQSGPAARAYVAAALQDPSRETELRAMLRDFPGVSR